jgi:hypothetical protein
MYQQIYDYIRTCTVCQERKIPKVAYEIQPTITPFATPFQYVSIDVKTMFPAADGSTAFLLFVDELSNFCKAFPISSENAKTIANLIICSDLGRAMDNEVTRFIASAMNYELNFVSVSTHHKNKAERYIGTIQNILIANLRSSAHLWPLFLKPSVFAMNIHSSPALQGYSPYEILYKTPPPSVDRFKIEDLTTPSGSFHEYLEQVKSRFKHIQRVITHARKISQEKRLIATSRTSSSPILQTGSMVYLLAPERSNLQTTNKKIKLSYVGPYFVYQMLNQNNCLLVDLYGTLIRNVFHVRRLKPAYLRSKNGSIITTKEQLKKALSITDNPTLQQFRHALDSQQIAITGNEPDASEPLPTTGNYNMHCTQINNDINLSLIPPGEKSKSKHPPAGDYSIVKSRFKDGNLEILLSHSHAQPDRKQSFFIAYNEIPHRQSEAFINMVKSIRVTGRPH